MSSDQMPRANVRIPSHLLEAAEMLAEERYSRHNKVSRAEIIRVALRAYLPEQDDLPEEARDLLDDDHEANAGAGEVEA